MDLGDASLIPVQVLGEGTFGRVFLCKCRSSKSVRSYRQQQQQPNPPQQQQKHQKSHVCVKRIIVHDPKIQMKMIMEEVYIISQLKHPRIVSFIRSFIHAGTVNIVMEYMSNGTLRDLITRFSRSPIPKQQVLNYFCDILMGLEYLHIRHVMHRDLKPENLLMDKSGRIKIADFGLSAIGAPGKECSTLGTPYYMAPEVLNGEKYDYKSDIWSVGCILFELCCGRGPFTQASSLSDLRYLIRVIAGKRLNCQQVTIGYGSVLGNVCEAMLTSSVQERISLPQIVCIDASITVPFYKQYFDYEY